MVGGSVLERVMAILHQPDNLCSFKQKLSPGIHQAIGPRKQEGHELYSDHDGVSPKVTSYEKSKEMRVCIFLHDHSVKLGMI